MKLIFNKQLKCWGEGNVKLERKHEPELQEPIGHAGSELASEDSGEQLWNSRSRGRGQNDSVDLWWRGEQEGVHH